jgi:hypothetical protein
MMHSYLIQRFVTERLLPISLEEIAACLAAGKQFPAAHPLRRNVKAKAPIDS